MCVRLVPRLPRGGGAERTQVSVPGSLGADTRRGETDAIAATHEITMCLLPPELGHPAVVLEAVAVPNIGIKSERLAGLDVQ